MPLRLAIWLSVIAYLTCQGQSYIGYVKKECQLLDSNQAVVDTIKRGEGVFVFSKDPNSKTYHINHIRTNKDGFVSKKNVYIVHEVLENTETAFSRVKESDKKDPVVRIHNNSHVTMRLKINGISHIIHPKEHKHVSIKKGKHMFIVTAPDMNPHYGKETLEDFKMYEWEFYID